MNCYQAPDLMLILFLQFSPSHRVELEANSPELLASYSADNPTWSHEKLDDIQLRGSTQEYIVTLPVNSIMEEEAERRFSPERLNALHVYTAKSL